MQRTSSGSAPSYSSGGSWSGYVDVRGAYQVIDDFPFFVNAPSIVCHSRQGLVLPQMVSMLPLVCRQPIEPIGQGNGRHTPRPVILKMRLVKLHGVCNAINSNTRRRGLCDTRTAQIGS